MAMTKSEALARVARHTAGLIQAGDFSEATGIMPHELDKMPERDVDRLSWALDEVTRRLYRMGKQPD
jgi:hypothetical protein